MQLNIPNPTLEVYENVKRLDSQDIQRVERSVFVPLPLGFSEGYADMTLTGAPPSFFWYPFRWQAFNTIKGCEKIYKNTVKLVDAK